MSIFDNGNRLTATALEQIKSHADMIDCECPTYLVEILEKIRSFESYTQDCITRYPNDAKTHVWLYESAQNLDALLSGTIAQLARIEGFINQDNVFMDRPVKTKK